MRMLLVLGAIGFLGYRYCWQVYTCERRVKKGVCSLTAQEPMKGGGEAFSRHPSGVVSVQKRYFHPNGAKNGGQSFTSGWILRYPERSRPVCRLFFAGSASTGVQVWRDSGVSRGRFSHCKPEVSPAETAGEDSNMCSRFDIETVIDQFKPAWLPEGNELPGVVVAIDPAGGGSADSQKRADDDAALMIGGYLFHLVQAGGGVPVMTRADDRAIPGDRDAYVAALCRAKAVDVAVTIDCSGESGSVARIGFVLESGVSADSGDGGDADESSESASGVGESNLPGVTCELETERKDKTDFEYRRFLYEQAVRVFKALVEFCSNQEDVLKGLRGDRSASGAVGSVPLFPNRTSEEALALAARKVWPDGNLPLEKAGWFCGMFVQTFHDHTFVYHEPVVSVEDDTVIISGATNVGILHHSLADALKVVGIPKVRNEMRLLPEQGRTGEDRFGLCVFSMALTYGGPAETKPLCTQLLYGEPVMLLDAEEDYYLICGRDGYCGWVRRECIEVVDCETYRRFSNGESAVFVEDTVLADRRIVRGSILPVVSAGKAEVTLLGCDLDEFAVPACNVQPD